MLIRVAESDSEIEACYPVMCELRPHVAASGFLERVRRQEHEGYRLAFVSHDAEVRAVAGYRFLEMLTVGRFLYVDDLVTQSDARSRGFGHALFQWLVGLARTENCSCLQLDSGVQRFDAHRFYLRERMLIKSHHFVLEL